MQRCKSGFLPQKKTFPRNKLRERFFFEKSLAERVKITEFILNLANLTCFLREFLLLTATATRADERECSETGKQAKHRRLRDNIGNLQAVTIVCYVVV